MINLTDDERRRFVLWLRQEAKVARGLVGQMKKLGYGMEPIIKHEEIRIAAKLLIARELDSTETMVVGG